MAAPNRRTYALIEQPLLLPTAAGPIAAMLTAPDGPPRAAVLVMQGWACSRADSNQLWTRTSRELARLGVTTLRADYSGRGESWDADPHERVSAAREVAQWFDAQTGGIDTVLVAYCYGLVPTSAILDDRDDVIGTALVNPPLHQVDPRPQHAARTNGIRRRLRTEWRRARILPRRVAYRLRFGPAQTWWAEQTAEARPWRQLNALIDHGPMWILAGAGDDSVGLVRALLAKRGGTDQVEFEVTEHELLNNRSPEAQATIRDGVIRWVTACLARAEAGTVSA